MPEEIIRTLGFRIIEKHGIWQLQRLNEEGKVIMVSPVLMPEVWTMWKMIEAQSEALRAHSA